MEPIERRIVDGADNGAHGPGAAVVNDGGGGRDRRTAKLTGPALNPLIKGRAAVSGLKFAVFEPEREFFNGPAVL